MPYYGLFIHCLPLIILVAVSYASMQHSHRLQPPIKTICFTNSRFYSPTLLSIDCIHPCCNFHILQQKGFCALKKWLLFFFFQSCDVERNVLQVRLVTHLGQIKAGKKCMEAPDLRVNPGPASNLPAAQSSLVGREQGHVPGFLTLHYSHRKTLFLQR